MCFHNSMSKKVKELAERYGRFEDILDSVRQIVEEQYHVSAFTNPDYPVVTAEKEMQVYKWGLVPFWEKTVKKAEEIRRMTYNAKAETLFQKPAFREPATSRRCIVPSTGFFEWRHEGDQKIPYYIYLKDSEIFSMAGIYDIWNNPETDELLYSFSIITTGANPLMASIHNTNKRMPVILSREDEEKWLDPKLSPQQVNGFLKPFDQDKMEAYIINHDFMKKDSRDPSILERQQAI